MNFKTPLAELQLRMLRFRTMMHDKNPQWEMAVIFGKINLFYFTGTMQDGMLIIPRDEAAVLWVRRSYERALDESEFAPIKPMESFKDAAGSYIHLPGSVYIETEVVPMALYQRFQKYFPFGQYLSLDGVVSALRAVKSPFELDFMLQSGRIHQQVLEECVPAMLKEGMSELDLSVQIYALLVEKGHHGLVRFSMFDTEMVIGYVAFGTNSIYPTNFNGPGGNCGLSPAVPLLGSSERKLKKGDLVFLDIGCGVNGYHTDKTMTYMFGKPLPEHAVRAHKQCVELHDTIAGMLVPGNIPAEIYAHVMDNLDKEFHDNFMGYGNRKVKFLGHSIGLTIDEAPVLAKGFDEPIQEHMLFAVEPKKGIKDIGMVGIENTFLVTPAGGKCITGDNKGLIPVY